MAGTGRPCDCSLRRTVREMPHHFKHPTVRNLKDVSSIPVSQGKEIRLGGKQRKKERRTSVIGSVANPWLSGQIGGV